MQIWRDKKTFDVIHYGSRTVQTELSPLLIVLYKVPVLQIDYYKSLHHFQNLLLPSGLPLHGAYFQVSGYKCFINLLRQEWEISISQASIRADEI